MWAPLRQVLSYLFLPVIAVAAVIASAYAALSSLPARLGRLGSSLNDVAAFRDGFLLVVATAYVLGYVAWSVHALQEHLGLLPALRFQYIFAGLVPLILLWLIASLVMAVRGIQSGIRAVVASFSVVVATAGISILAIPFVGVGGVGLYVCGTLLLFAAGVLFGAVGFLPIAVPWVGLSVAFVGIAFYVSVLYAEIPQELGGVRPSCAYLDVKAKEIGEPALADLSGDRVRHSESVVRTGKVSVLFVGNDFFLVRPRHSGKDAVYRIAKNTVTVVTTCD
jgi:hypothetical protein